MSKTVKTTIIIIAIIVQISSGITIFAIYSALTGRHVLSPGESVTIEVPKPSNKSSVEGTYLNIRNPSGHTIEVSGDTDFSLDTKDERLKEFVNFSISEGRVYLDVPDDPGVKEQFLSKGQFNKMGLGIKLSDEGLIVNYRKRLGLWIDSKKQTIVITNLSKHRTVVYATVFHEYDNSY